MFIAHVIDAVLQLKDQFSGTLKNVNGNLSKFQKQANYIAKDTIKVGKSIEGVGKKLTTHLTAPLVGLGVMAAKANSQFTDSLAKVSTIADTTKVPIASLGKDIIKLSNDTGIASAEIANNVYDAISAGQKTEDAVNFVKNSTKLAKAGFAEAGQSLDVLTTIMNAYKMKAEDVTKVNDYLITTQNEGKVTVGELSSVMGKVIPTAVATNTSLKQVTAGYALMTKNGIKAAETTTYMNSMLNEMSKTGSVADKAIRKMSGKSFSQLMKEGKNVSDVLNMLDGHAKKNKLSLKDMFGSAEAGKAALVLSTSAGKDFNEMLSKMDKSAGATEKAYDKLQTPGEKFRKSLNKAKNVLISTGGALSPMLESLTGYINKITDKLSNLTPKQQESIVKFALFAATIGPVVLGVGKLTTKVGTTIKSINKFSESISKAGGVMKFLATPGMKIVLVMSAIAIVALLVIKNWDKLSAVFKKVGKSISEFTGISKKDIQKFGAFIGNFLKITGGKLKKAFSEVGSLILPPLKKLFGTLKTIFQSLMPILMPILKFIGGVFVVGICFAFSKMVTVISAVIKTIGAVIGGLITILDGIINFIVGVFTGNWRQAWNGIKSIFSGVLKILEGLWNGLVDLLTAPVEAIVNILDAAFKEKVAWIKDAWNGLKEFLKNPIQGTVNLVKKGANWVGDKISGKNALGTSYWGGGYSVVGEHGPEVVELPSGSKVHDTRNSKGLGGGINIAKLADTIVVREDADIDKIADALVRKLKKTNFNMA